MFLITGFQALWVRLKFRDNRVLRDDISPGGLLMKYVEG
jgi:hypothetical protein